MNHLATDVVVDLKNCIALTPLSNRLTQVSVAGAETVGTVSELFDKTNKQSPELKMILAKVADGSSLRFAIQTKNEHHDLAQCAGSVVRSEEGRSREEPIRLNSKLKTRTVCHLMLNEYHLELRRLFVCLVEKF